jgi:hypothetical protein
MEAFADEQPSLLLLVPCGRLTHATGDAAYIAEKR